MGTRITGSTKRVEDRVALGRRCAELLAGNPAVSDLAPAVTVATDALVRAKDARKVAANARYVARQAADEADKALLAAVRAVQHHVLEACDGNRADGTYRTLFPGGVTPLLQGSRAARERARYMLAHGLHADPGLAEFAKRLDEALAAHDAAVEAWKASWRADQASVLELAVVMRACQVACIMARHMAVVRLNDAVAASRFFPWLGGRNRTAPEPPTAPDGGGTVTPDASGPPKADAPASPPPETGQEGRKAA